MSLSIQSITYIQSLSIFLLTTVVHAAREDLIAIIQRLNSDLLELRNEIEYSISNRCDSIAGCSKSSYHECQSEYTRGQTCPAFEKYGYAIPECGSGVSCNGLFDHTISTVRLPSNLASGLNSNPTDADVVEAVCYTRTAQRWMVQKYNQDEQFWQAMGVSSPQMFFGSSTGVFRIFPARSSRECGVYDPRVRPWYQATVPSVIGNSVKPRNVVILMDTSRSMNDTINAITGETKLSFVKNAAISTISALSDKASIAVVRFGEVASIVGQGGIDGDVDGVLFNSPPFWQKATSDHKKRLVDEINGMDVSGRSNWMAGYNYAFELIRNSLRQNEDVDTYACELENIALLFFSDGVYNLPGGVTDEQVINFVSSNVKEVEAMGDYHLHTFLYSVGNTDTNQIMKRISCEVDGYWTPVSGKMSSGNITNGYQALFSTPMGTQAFYNYTSWSEPYIFTSSGKLGYTVSGLVYNRDVQPPLFMGAVGMDISAEAAKQLYGGTMEETVQVMNEIIDEIKETKFNATCDQQRINLTFCEVQSLRQLAGGSGAICVPPDVNATNQTITGDDDDVFSNCSKGFLTHCPGYDEYPTELWQNVNQQDKTYQDRVCCEVGTNNVSSNCPELDEIRDTKLSDAAIFGIIFALLAMVEILCCYFCFYHKKKRNA